MGTPSEADKERENIHLKAKYAALLLSPMYAVGALWILIMIAAAWQMYSINQTVNGNFGAVSAELNSGYADDNEE